MSSTSRFRDYLIANLLVLFSYALGLLTSYAILVAFGRPIAKLFLRLFQSASFIRHFAGWADAIHLLIIAIFFSPALMCIAMYISKLQHENSNLERRVEALEQANVTLPD